MKVLLVSTNRLRPSRELPWMSVVPLGAAYVAAALRRAGHEVSLLDLCFSRQFGDDLDEAIGRFQPDVVGFSFRNIEMVAYFRNESFLNDLKASVDRCRARSRARIVLGGSGFSVMPREITRFTGVDLGIIGEGESSLPQLVAGLERGEGYPDVPGLISMRNGIIHVAPPDRPHSLAGLVTPARDLIDHQRYIEANGMANLQTKRGCALKCIYCTYPMIEGNEVRCRPPSEVVEEFRELSERYGVRSAYVVDSQFNNPPDHAKEICEKLVSERPKGKIWWSCMVNPGRMDDELALLMRLARCSMADLGVDAASDSMLERLGKGFTKGDIARTMELLIRYRIPFTTWILLGGPGEDERTIRETLDFLVEHEVHDVLFSIGLRIYPGTALEERAREEGLLDGARDLLEPVFYLSMDAERIAALVDGYLSGRKGWRIAARRHPDD